MDETPREVLKRWPVAGAATCATRIVNPHSYSGAAVWRVDGEGQSFALRRWPAAAWPGYLDVLHDVQNRLAAGAPHLVPQLQVSDRGGTWVAHGERLWELSRWMLGAADYSECPSKARLQAAMRALAEVHVGAAPTHATLRNSPSMLVRAERLAAIERSGIDVNMSALRAAPAGEAAVADEARVLVRALAPPYRRLAAEWAEVPLALQPRLGDVHEGNVLFTGEEVTGIVDYGAADIDSPAGDVARLLGSLAGDDADGWRLGLAAYQSVRPLSEDEIALVRLFDASGTVAAAANWVRWLWGPADVTRPPVKERDAAVARLRRLVERLRVLASRNEIF